MLDIVNILLKHSQVLSKNVFIDTTAAYVSNKRLRKAKRF